MFQHHSVFCSPMYVFLHLLRALFIVLRLLSDLLSLTLCHYLHPLFSQPTAHSIPLLSSLQLRSVCPFINLPGVSRCLRYTDQPVKRSFMEINCRRHPPCSIKLRHLRVYMRVTLYISAWRTASLMSHVCAVLAET